MASRRYKRLPSGHKEQLGPELITAFTNSTANPYETLVTSGVDITSAINTVGNGSVYSVADSLSIVTGERYRLTFDFVLNSGNTPSIIIATNGDGIAGVSSNVITGLTTGSYSEILIASATTAIAELCIYRAGLTTNFSMTNVSLKKILVEETKEILNILAQSGSVVDRYEGDVVGDEIITDPTFQDPSLWTLDRWTISNGVATCSSGLSSTIQLTGPADVNVIGKTYRITKFVESFSGTSLRFYVDGTSGFAIDNTVGFSFNDVVCGNIVETHGMRVTNSSGDCSVSYLSIKEVRQAPVLTAVSVYKDGPVNAMYFDGATSKVNCGTPDTLVGDKSFILWVKGHKYSGAGTYLISNTQFALAFNTPDNLLSITSDGGGTIANDAYTLPLDIWTLIIVVRNAAGLIDFYVNGEIVYSALDTGTPAAGTDIIINSEPTSFKGLMNDVRIKNGLITAPEASQIFSSEKALYRL